MAMNIPNGDYLEFASRAGSISFWMKTTQNPGGIPCEIVSQHQSTASGPGWGFTMDSSGHGQIYGKSSPSNQVLGISDSTVTLNDGNWHHIALCFWFSTALPQALWIDGVNKAQAFNGGNFSTSINGRIGRSNDGFWPGYVGQIAEVGIWGGPSVTGYLPDDAIRALAKGFRPPEVYTKDFKAYMPLVGDKRDLVALDGQPGITGGVTFVDHNLRLF